MTTEEQLQACMHNDSDGTEISALVNVLAARIVDCDTATAEERQKWLSWALGKLPEAVAFYVEKRKAEPC